MLELGVGAVDYESLGGCGSDFSLYLRNAAVPLQSGSLWRSHID